MGKYTHLQMVYVTGSIAGYKDEYEALPVSSKKHYYVKIERNGERLYLANIKDVPEGKICFTYSGAFAKEFSESQAIKIVNELREQGIKAGVFSTTAELAKE